MSFLFVIVFIILITIGLIFLDRKYLLKKQEKIFSSNFSDYKIIKGDSAKRLKRQIKSHLTFNRGKAIDLLDVIVDLSIEAENKYYIFPSRWQGDEKVIGLGAIVLDSNLLLDTKIEITDVFDKVEKTQDISAKLFPKIHGSYLVRSTSETAAIPKNGSNLEVEIIKYKPTYIELFAGGFFIFKYDESDISSESIDDLKIFIDAIRR